MHLPPGAAVKGQVYPQPDTAAGEEDGVAVENAAIGENTIQDGKDLPHRKRIQERQAKFGNVLLHSPVSASHGISRQRSLPSGASEPTSVSRTILSVLDPPQDSRTVRLRSRSPSPDIESDQEGDSEETSLLTVERK